MYPTPRFLAQSCLGVLLAVLAVVFDDPILLVGTAILGGWLIAREVAFTDALRKTIDRLTVVQHLERTTIRTGGTNVVTLAATLTTPSLLELSVESGLPAATTVDSGPDPLSITLAPRARETSANWTVEWPVSGRHEFEPATVTASDGGLREQVTVENRPTVTVEPRGDEPIHIGSGGDRLGTAYGEHEGGRLGSGDDPAEPREYVPGDTADKIDWKATARLDTTYVREFDTETDRRTTLVVDHRSTLTDGPPAGTKFDHLREAALSIAERTYGAGDPVGLITVDGDGISTHIEHTTTGGTYRTIHQRLLDLDPTADSGRGPERRLTGDEARSHLTALAGETGRSPDDAFETTLRPFYSERASGVDRIDAESLTDAIRAANSSQQQPSRTVIFTDDSRPEALRETVSLARSRGNEVLLLLTPSVLYETQRLTALERSFDRYVAFEELRRDLSGLERVTALEVGPGDRLSTLLDVGRRRGDAA